MIGLFSLFTFLNHVNVIACARVTVTLQKIWRVLPAGGQTVSGPFSIFFGSRLSFSSPLTTNISNIGLFGTSSGPSAQNINWISLENDEKISMYCLLNNYYKWYQFYYFMLLHSFYGIHFTWFTFSSFISQNIEHIMHISCNILYFSFSMFYQIQYRFYASS